MSRNLSREIQQRTLELIRTLFATRFALARVANPTDDSGEFDEWTLAPNESLQRIADEWDDGGGIWLAPAQDE